MTDELIATILGLSPAERVRIAQVIWESVDEIPETTDFSNEQRLELVRRLSVLKEQGSRGRPWKDVLNDITSQP